MKAFAALLLLLPFARAQGLPEGAGKAQVEDVCSSCHGLDFVLAEHGNKQRWTTIVNDMITRGATIGDEDLRVIVDYLARNFGPEKIHLNKAAAQDIESALELSSKEAAAIVQYRKDHGDFKDWPSVTKVPDIDPKKLEGKSDRVVFD